jgi:hypothetical protein
VQLLTEFPDAQCLAQIMAPATGHASAVDSEPYAIHQLGLLGQGVIFRPNTPRICAPTRCKVALVSPDRRVWVLAMPGRMRLRLEIDTQSASMLPLAHAAAQPGDVCDAGSPLCTLTPGCMQHQPRLVLTLSAPEGTVALLPHYGRAMVTQDAILSIFPWVEPTEPEQEETL